MSKKGVEKGVRWVRVTTIAMIVTFGGAVVAHHLDRPIVSAVFFYWYEWDGEAEWGNWLGGVHNTPLYGYYDNRKLQDNFHSLLLAADWGLTHFFIDYWGHDWRGENNEPREKTVLKAAEKVRSLGYPIFIGYYQDGENFAMRDFWRNIDERRDTYRWLFDYAFSPAWTWLLGKPFQMVYARNGVPELTIEHEGFQEWLRKRYSTIDKLNAEWGTNFRGFSEIRMDFNAVGFQRAMSVAYQYERWQRDWEKLEQLIRHELGLPGLRVSFDVGYGPFRNFGFERFARIFGGPHSYAGIFGQPHEQDAERFLQTAVAKRCRTVFFDHLKHHYFDWNIRVPGIAYPPEPHHFDRFWVGNLMRFADGVLHLSWNEWWEGSNLEPSMEKGKRFCESNLLYSTIWQLTYHDNPHLALRTPHEVGLLVNDWIFEHGGGDERDLYNAVQSLRAVNAPFEVVLQSETTLENLKRFRVLVAPAGGVGFGFNAEGEPIDKVLQYWLRLGGRVLITSQGGAWGSGHGTSQKGRSIVSPAQRPSSHSFNFFVDVGFTGDEAILVQGFSGREDWGKLPEGAFGAGSQATVRWTPAFGNKTVILLPTDLAWQKPNLTENMEHRPPKNSAPRAPHPILILRWHGSAIWDNKVRVFANEQFVDEVSIESGWKVYEVPLPVEIVGGSKVIEIRFEFAEAHIPGEKDPQRFRGEQRVCNLALDWVQICTLGVPIGERKSFKWQPTELAEFSKEMRKVAYTKQFRSSLLRRRSVMPSGKVLSTYSDGIPRDILISVNSSLAPCPSFLLFVNGIFTDDPRWWATILEQVAKVQCGKFAWLDGGKLPDKHNLMSAVLTAGKTKFLLVENRKGDLARLRLTVPFVEGLPIAEVLALSRDGSRFVLHPKPLVPFADAVRHYAVYQVVFSPVKLSMPKWIVFPGQKTNLPIRVQNLTKNPITIALQVGTFVASIKGRPVELRLKPREQRQVSLPIEVEAFADWGTKTVFVKGTWSSRQGTRETAYWLRPLIVGRRADVRCLTAAVTSHTPTITIINAPTTPFGDLNWWHPALDVPGETAREVEVILRLKAGDNLPEGIKLQQGIRLSIGSLRDGERKQVHLPLPFTASPVQCSLFLTLRWCDSAGVHERTVPVNAMMLPKESPKTHLDQIATIVIVDEGSAQGMPMFVDLPESVEGCDFLVRLPDGTPLPTHTEKLVRSKARNEVECRQSLKGIKHLRRVHFIVPPMKSLWRVDIGSEGDETVLMRYFSYRETWAGDLTIRWLPGEGRETSFRVPKPKVESPAYRLLLCGQAHWGNKATVFAGDRKLTELDIRTGQQTLVVLLPASLWERSESVEVRLVFHQAHVPAEKIKSSTDRRVCNFALDWIALEPAFDGRPLLLALCRAEKKQTPQISVRVRKGVVQVDNGVWELEWHEDAGGTLTKLLSKATRRNYAAQSFGSGIGLFGHYDPENPAITADKFILDDFAWQRNGKAKIKVVEQNPVWVTVEVVGHWTGDTGYRVNSKRVGFKAVQRYRVFAGLPLIELQVFVEPLKPSFRSPALDSCELVALEARFNARWWTKSFPNFVGLGDKPPEVYGQNVLHFGWRMGNWLPPVLCLFNPNDLTETLSLLVVENSSLGSSGCQVPYRPKDEGGANWVRQGFWGEVRGKPSNERKYATIELIAKPPKPVRLRLWLCLHEGHHLQAKRQRQKLIVKPSYSVIPCKRDR